MDLNSYPCCSFQLDPLRFSVRDLTTPTDSLFFFFFMHTAAAFVTPITQVTFPFFSHPLLILHLFSFFLLTSVRSAFSLAHAFSIYFFLRLTSARRFPMHGFCPTCALSPLPACLLTCLPRFYLPRVVPSIPTSLLTHTHSPTHETQ